MNHLVATLFFGGLIVAGVAATIMGWLRFARSKKDSTLSRWREAALAVSAALLTASALLFIAYGMHNAMIGGDRNGSQATLSFIRTGNSLSLLSIVGSLIGVGKGRWPTFVGGLVFLFLWFAQGVSL